MANKAVKKALNAISKTLSSIDELDVDTDTQDEMMLPYLNTAQQLLATILAMGETLTDVTSDDDDADAEEDEDDAEEDGEDDADEDGEDDDFAEDDDEDDADEEEADEDDADEDDADFEDADEEEEEEEAPAPRKKVTKPAAKPVAKASAKPAAKPVAKKTRKPDYDAMGFQDFLALMVAEDRKRGAIINKVTAEVGPRAKAKTAVAAARKRGWID